MKEKESLILHIFQVDTDLDGHVAWANEELGISFSEARALLRELRNEKLIRRNRKTGSYEICQEVIGDGTVLRDLQS